ncbi:hypothetical protein BDY21DRAFT_135870 [Lineolata rhizophorae]|uniref:Uncharacterized protein n=1 Tax=Lineolata rhizophorae TaxID=578093 RepID=A0A6A6PAK7_9PEZI|nr:hypothetical protein BDY21DRAFT_135870 [Lineolata rhizophorae]
MATSPIVAQVADLPCLDDFLKPYQISATDAIKANVVDYMKRLEESFEPIEGEPDTTPRRRASASEGADELVPAAHVVNAGRLDNKLQEWKRWEPERRGSLASASIRRTSGSNRPLHLASSFSTSDQSSSVEEVPVSIADYPTEDRSRSIVMARLPHIHRSHDRNHTWELTTKGIMKLILFYVPDAKINSQASLFKAQAYGIHVGPGIMVGFYPYLSGSLSSKRATTPQQ